MQTNTVSDSARSVEEPIDKKKLEKQLREHDIRSKKESALLTQKIDLLKIELKDSHDREKSTQRLHDTMLSAFKDNSKDVSQYGDGNIDKLINEYKNKVDYLASRNQQLEDSLSNANRNQRQNSEDWSEHVNIIEELTLTIQKIENENENLKEQLEQFLSPVTEEEEDETKNLSLNHQIQIQNLEKRYEQSISELIEKHEDEKSMLIDKLETKDTYTFGERNINYNEDSQSTYSLRDEVDKLHFVIEEKDYMNEELRLEVIQLRKNINRKIRENNYDSEQEDYKREATALKKENKRMQDDLNRTEENNNEQILLYKQKLNFERQRTIEVKEESTEIRTKYDAKINIMMQKQMDKEDEIVKLKGELRDNNDFLRSSITRSPSEFIGDHSLQQKHQRSYTPGNAFYANHHNNSNLMSSYNGSARSSINLHQHQNVGSSMHAPDNDNANVFEWMQCNTVMTPNECHKASHAHAHDETSKGHRPAMKSYSAGKSSFNYRIDSPWDYRDPEGYKHLNTSSCQHCRFS
jgi:hypothetical protein